MRPPHHPPPSLPARPRRPACVRPPEGPDALLVVRHEYAARREEGGWVLRRRRPGARGGGTPIADPAPDGGALAGHVLADVLGRPAPARLVAAFAAFLRASDAAAWVLTDVEVRVWVVGRRLRLPGFGP